MDQCLLLYITKQVAEERLSQVVTSHVDAANKHNHQLLSSYINQAKIIFLDGLADKTRRIFKDCFVDKSNLLVTAPVVKK